ncbi:hypothetical protein IP76_13685 [Rhizobium sp. AAP43]|nr:hypothetical protein IP76_13685 [Rhizobium sp. AAP43]
MASGSISANALILATALFIFKQLVADYFLQTTWMALGKEKPKGWLPPLVAHVSVHAACTLTICLTLSPALFWLALVDFVIHGTIDRSKSLMQLRLQLSPNQGKYWWLLGSDQTLHHLTHLAFAVAIASSVMTPAL